MGIQVFEDFFDLIFNARVLEEVAVGIGGNGKPIGNIDALLVEFLIHLPQRGVLPAHHGNVLYADLIEPKNEPFALVRSHEPSPSSKQFQGGTTDTAGKSTDFNK
jgi:hypothetical protein